MCVERSGQSSTATGTTNATPLSDDDSVPSDSEFEEAEEEVSDLSDLSTSDSEVDVPLSRGKGSARGSRGGAQGGKAARAPSTKGKTAAKGKTKKFQGKGRKLGGSDSEEEKSDEAEALDDEDESLSEISDPNMSWLEKRQMQKRKERRHAAREAAPRKKKERELAKKLGRKLTNGEKNLIALCMVSHVLSSWPVRRHLTFLYSIVPSSKTCGAIFKPILSLSNPSLWRLIRRSSLRSYLFRRKAFTG